MSIMPIMKRRWIITGANGYLGGRLCENLHSLGENALAVVRAGRFYKGLQEMDIPCYTYEDLSSILSRGDILVHCAGKVGNNGTWNEFVKINRDWTLSLFKQAQVHDVSCFIYVSSVAALGYNSRPGGAVLDESSLPTHVGGEFYGKSKLLTEQALLDCVALGTTRLIILRPGLIYGRRPLASSNSWFMRSVVVDPYQRIPLVHIDNFTAAVTAVVNHPDAQGVFLVVDEEQPTLRDLNALKIRYGILRYTPWYIGKPGFWLRYFFRTIVRLLSGHVGANLKDRTMADYCFQTRRLIYSTEKLRAQVGWMPTVTLENGLKECCLMETTAEMRQ